MNAQLSPDNLKNSEFFVQQKELKMEDSTEKTVGKKFQKSYFDVLGLCCSSEVPLVEKILASLDGVKDFSVIIPTKTVIVVHDSLLVSQVQIVKALNQARLEANIRIHGEMNYKNKWPSPYAVACGALLLLSFLKYAWSPLQWLAVAAIAVGIPPVLLKAVAAVRNLTIDINILVLIAVAGSLCLHDYWEAATIVFLFTIAEWLESRASHKATSVMSSLVSLVPQKAVLADTGEEINVDEVKLNTILSVKAGEVIPIDGVVVVGNCEVDEKILTGESFPVSKEKDSTVWASTINLNGYITVKTTSVAEDCVVARMAKLVEEAQNQKSRTQRFLDKCAKFYTPAIVVISACLAIVPLVFHVQNKKEWYHLALVILVSGCPCALLLSTPVAMFCALSKAATLGVLFKGAEHLETLAQVKIMAFDKTGTITRGEFLVADVRSLQDGIKLNKMLEWISSIESKSSHPMAAALVDFARSQGIEPKPDEVENFQNFPGEGICGRIEDHEIYIGNKKIASRAGCSEVPTLEGYDTEEKSVGYVFLGSSLAGVFSLGDVCRTGAKEAIKELKSIGIKTVMLTGDCHAAAKQTQAQLMDALDVIHSELLPEDKARIVKDFQKEGPTAMIGDGINDALALATADIGISMGVSGSALATESGDVILMSNDIQRIPKAVRIAKKVKRKIIENVIISITTKAAIIALAIAGHPYVWAAVLTDVGTCLVVIFNSMLLLRGTPSQGKKSCRPSISSHSHQHKCKTVNGCSSHTHDHSSNGSDIESQKKCGTKCSSSNSTLRSCDDKKCSSSVKEHVHKTHSHPHNQASTKNHNCCHKVTHDLAPQIVNSHGCSGKETCGKKNDCGETTERHDHGVEEHAHMIHIHPQNQAGATDHHRCCQKVNQDLVVNSHECSGKARCSEKTIERHDHGGEEHAHKTHFHPDNQVSATNHHCCPKVTQDLVVNNHGCSGKARCIEKTTERHNHGAEEHAHKTHFHPQSQASATAQKGSGCASEHELHETKKHEHVSHSTGCKSSLQSPVSIEHAISSNHCQESHHGHHKKDEHKEHCHSECEKHASEHGEILRPCVSKLGCNDSVGSSSSGPGAAINKTHGGCCDSFRRECCMKNGHLGTSFGGGLSEIVIEQ